MKNEEVHGESSDNKVLFLHSAFILLHLLSPGDLRVLVFNPSALMKKLEKIP